MARQQSREAIKKEIAALEAKLKAHDKAAAERIGMIALKAGLDEIDIPEAELAKEFDGIVERFQKRPAQGKPQAVAQAQPKAPPSEQPAGDGQAAHPHAA